MLTDIEMMTISNLDFLHYMTAVSHEMSDEPKICSCTQVVRGFAPPTCAYLRGTSAEVLSIYQLL